MYEEQGRTYSDSDAVTFCHTKDIFFPRGRNIDSDINNFVSNKDIAVISISNYVTPNYVGALILYIDVIEQQKKMEAKQLEVAKMQEEIVEKYDGILGAEDNQDEQNTKTAGLMQVNGEVKEPESTVTTIMSEQETVIDGKKKKRFWRK